MAPKRTSCVSALVLGMVDLGRALLMDIRFLLLDVHVGVSKPASAKSAISVLVVSLLLTLIFGLKLFGLF